MSHSYTAIKQEDSIDDAYMVQEGEEQPPSLKSCSKARNRENAAEIFLLENVVSDSSIT